MIQLKRFVFDLSTLSRRKLNHRVAFPASLSLEPYGRQPLEGEGFSAADGHAPTLPPSTPPVLPPSTPLGEYRCVGVLVHSGSAHGGHYFALLRDGDTEEEELRAGGWVGSECERGIEGSGGDGGGGEGGEGGGDEGGGEGGGGDGGGELEDSGVWFEFNDATVRRARPGSLRESQGSGAGESGASGYLLIYERVGAAPGPDNEPLPPASVLCEVEAEEVAAAALRRCEAAVAALVEVTLVLSSDLSRQPRIVMHAETPLSELVRMAAEEAGEGGASDFLTRNELRLRRWNAADPARGGSPEQPLARSVEEQTTTLRGAGLAERATLLVEWRPRDAYWPLPDDLDLYLPMHSWADTEGGETGPPSLLCVAGGLAVGATVSLLREAVAIASGVPPALQRLVLTRPAGDVLVEPEGLLSLLELRPHDEVLIETASSAVAPSLLLAALEAARHRLTISYNDPRPPPAVGLEPLFSEGLTPPAVGLKPPAIAMGLKPPAVGLDPFAMGLKPPAVGLMTSAVGLDPFAVGLKPPAVGQRPPPAVGLEPPAVGLTPSAVVLDLFSSEGLTLQADARETVAQLTQRIGAALGVEGPLRLRRSARGAHITCGSAVLGAGGVGLCDGSAVYVELGEPLREGEMLVRVVWAEGDAGAEAASSSDAVPTCPALPGSVPTASPAAPGTPTLAPGEAGFKVKGLGERLGLELGAGSEVEGLGERLGLEAEAVSLRRVDALATRVGARLGLGTEAGIERRVDALATRVGAPACELVLSGSATVAQLKRAIAAAVSAAAASVNAGVDGGGVDGGGVDGGGVDGGGGGGGSGEGVNGGGGGGGSGEGVDGGGVAAPAALPTRLRLFKRSGARVGGMLADACPLRLALSGGFDDKEVAAQRLSHDETLGDDGLLLRWRQLLPREEAAEARAALGAEKGAAAVIAAERMAPVATATAAAGRVVVAATEAATKAAAEVVAEKGAAERVVAAVGERPDSGAVPNDSAEGMLLASELRSGVDPNPTLGGAHLSAKDMLLASRRWSGLDPSPKPTPSGAHLSAERTLLASGRWSGTELAAALAAASGIPPERLLLAKPPSVRQLTAQAALALAWNEPKLLGATRISAVPVRAAHGELFVVRDSQHELVVEEKRGAGRGGWGVHRPERVAAATSAAPPREAAMRIRTVFDD